MEMTEKEIKRTIEQTVRAICGLLDMEVPKISYDTSLFPSETTQALAEVSDTAPPVLYIRPVSFLSGEKYFKEKCTQTKQWY